MDATTQRASVAEYYGTTLQTTADLRTSACCPIDAVPAAQRAILGKLHPEVLSRFYGCGSPIPELLDGCVVLDLGCGTGRDAYIASALVGSEGRVVGVDMTATQLEVAKKYRDFHASALLGGKKSNVEFVEGIIEDLTSCGVADGTVDVVISNCVCNLSPDKKAVFAGVAKVLKEGGEFYFSDVYADRRLSAEAAAHDVLVGECLGGALYVEDFRRIMAEVGLCDVRVVSCGVVEVQDPELSKLVPDVTFYSITIRAFKVAALEDRRENFGQVATYSSGSGDGFELDVDFNFPKGVAVHIDGNTAAVLEASRFSKNFTVTPRGQHQGLFAPDVEGGALGAMISRALPSATAACCAPAPASNVEGAAAACCAAPGQTPAANGKDTQAASRNGAICCAPSQPAPETKTMSGSACCGPSNGGCC